MRIAVIVKQVPRFEEMSLDESGRLRREGVELELNPFCRRAVSMARKLAREHGGHVTVVTLGPPAAEDILREAVAWGCDEGVLITDPRFAGSDTLASARALAAALRLQGPFDLVLCGRNSVDADTGQVGPEVAELLDLPFAGPARALQVDGDRLELRCETDDGHVELSITLPAVISCAERLIEPAKVEPERRAEVPAQRIRRLDADDLGPGPWGMDGSPTRVGRVRLLEVERARQRLDGPLSEQVRRAVAALQTRGALREAAPVVEALPRRAGGAGPAVSAVVEPGLDVMVAELAGEAVRLAALLNGRAVVIGCTRGIDAAVDEVLTPALPVVAEDAANAVDRWLSRRGVRDGDIVLFPGTVWGREVASRVAARRGAGLVGDAVELDVEDGHFVAWKPALSGALVACITVVSPLQMATVRPGAMHPPPTRAHEGTRTSTWEAVAPRGRLLIHHRERTDDIESLTRAQVVMGIGAGVPPEEYSRLEPLRAVLGAELAASRRVTDNAWMPRSRQVGITGHSVRPRLFVSVATAGKFNHVVGFRAARTVLAINVDPRAPIFEHADVGITGDWREALPLLTEALQGAAQVAGAPPT